MGIIHSSALRRVDANRKPQATLGTPCQGCRFRPVPRFHFHTENGVRFTDVHGIELPDLEAAKTSAVQVLTRALHDERHDFWSNESLRVIVSDEDDLTLFSLDLSLTRSPAAPRLDHHARGAHPPK